MQSLDCQQPNQACQLFCNELEGFLGFLEGTRLDLLSCETSWLTSKSLFKGEKAFSFGSSSSDQSIQVTLRQKLLAVHGFKQDVEFCCVCWSSTVLEEMAFQVMKDMLTLRVTLLTVGFGNLTGNID